MRTCTCPTCGTPKPWQWEDAFLRDGYFKGDDTQTEVVADALRAAGFSVVVDDSWEGNPFIDRVLRNGTPVYPETNWPGEVDSRDLLPADLINLLDDAFPEGQRLTLTLTLDLETSEGGHPSPTQMAEASEALVSAVRQRLFGEGFLPADVCIDKHDLTVN